MSIDAPIILSRLLRHEDERLLRSAEADLGCAICLIDGAGRCVLGAPPPGPVLLAEPGAEPVYVSAGSAAYLCAALYHDGDRLALIVAGPFPAEDEKARRRAAFLCHLADVLIMGAIRQTLSARMHAATVEESFQELSKKNQRLEQAVLRMQELDRIKANFLATISHELRTPLTSVLGYSEMLMEELAGPLNKEQKEYLQTVIEKGEQLLSLITGILDISRMESSGLKVHPSRLSLRQLVDDVLRTMTPQARRKRIDLSSEAEAELPEIEGDRDKLRQVLLNLVGNAIKFTHEDGRVMVKLGRPSAMDTPPDTHVRITVLDNGIGVPPHLHERIFEPFYQVDNSSTREYEGTGLGLSIVRNIVDAHGGRVWVQSNTPRGSIFHVVLPITLG